MADCKDYFISTDEVRRITPMSKGTEDAKILPFFDFAHVVVEQVLGRTLYDIVLAAKVAETLTADQTTLINEFICPYISWHTYQDALPSLYMVFSKNGMHTSSDDSHSAVSEDFVRKLDQNADNKVKEFQERLIDHLKCNTDIFPEYSICVDNEDRLTRTIRGGIVPRLNKQRGNANAQNEGRRSFNDKFGFNNGYY